MSAAHSPGMRSGRGAPIAVSALAAGLLLALAVGWRLDRARRWEAPRLEGVGLVLLAGDRSHTVPGETWVVAVHPACPHCLHSLARLRAAHQSGMAGVRLEALIVDEPRRPPARLASELGVDQVWWDSTGAWRRRWGHRIYGEVLRFDVAGRYWRTDPPLSSAATARNTPALVWVPPPDRRSNHATQVETNDRGLARRADARRAGGGPRGGGSG
jgi:hypothetical protein